MLEILNEGPANGTRYEIRSPLTRVGRGVYNDVELHHESVSDSHATLQWRDDGWYVVDMESTNGTYVGGSRISSERRIEGLSDVRFGELRFRFTAIGGFDSDAKGTRAIAAMRPPAMGSPRAVKTPDSPPTAKPPTTSPSSMPTAEPEMTGGSSAMVWVVIGLAVVAAVAFFLLKR
jgi:LPXTG-motif cell wall-anchored protein